ncbi:MAG: transglutaminase-like domain-containing protein [Thermoanaerobaculia bacterium]|nr:transglutaminase-like domain-containing protein [Thermoanaerobaculia bacterium]
MSAGWTPARSSCRSRPPPRCAPGRAGRFLPGGDEERLQQLLLALLQRDGRELRYDRDRTSTAIEVWRDGVANCLSFTHLFVALAREIGLPVYYLRVMDAPRYQREGVSSSPPSTLRRPGDRPTGAGSSTSASGRPASTAARR